MSMVPTVQDNSPQRDYWTGDAGKGWALFQQQLDDSFEDITARLLDAPVLGGSGSVLDIGCGSGAVSLALAARGFTVTGVDISPLLLDIARARVAAAGAAVTLIEADAASHPLPAAAFDGLISRFGVMFFADPQAAFAHLRHSLKPGGWLRFVCWQSESANEWAGVPAAALKPLIGTLPERPDFVGAPGPFAFADPDRISAILHGAGFADIKIAPARTAMLVGKGAEALEQATRFCCKVGPAAAALRGVDEHSRAELAPPLMRAALQPFLDAETLALPAAIWIVEARQA